MLTAVDVRRRRILGAVSVAFGILLIVLAIMAMTGSLGATTKKAAAGGDGAGQTTAAGETSGEQSAGESDGSGESSGSESASSSEAPAAEKLPLTVLNAGGTGGLAAAGQAAFEAQEWTVAEIGNYVDEPPAQSTVYYPADGEDAKASAELLVSEFPELVAEQAPDGFAYSGLVVVLAGEWQPGG